MQAENDSNRLTAKQCRLLAGLTQPELSGLSGVSKSTIATIENGVVKNPAPVVLEKIGLAIERRSKDRHRENASLPIVTYREYVLSLGA